MGTPAENIYDEPDLNTAAESDGEGVLGALLERAGTTTPEAAERARYWSDPKRLEDSEAQEAALIKQLEANSEGVKQSLRDAQQRLLSLRISPREQQLRETSALLAPTRTGRMGDTLSNLSNAMLTNEEQNRQYELAKAEGAGQLQQQLSGIDASTIKAKLALQEARDKILGQMGSKALTTLGRQIGPTKPQGKWVFRQNQAPDGKIQNAWVNPVTQEVKPIGDPFAKFPEPSDAVIDGIGQYNLPGPTSAYAEAHPESMDLLNKVKAKYPGFDASIQPAIAATRRAWAVGGQQANKTASLNMAISHLHLLDTAYDALHNNNITLLNHIGNGLGLQTGKEAPAVFGAIQGFVGTELTNAISQSSTGEERDNQVKRINRDFATPVGHDVIQTYRALLVPRLETERGKWESGMQLGIHPTGSPQYNALKHQFDQEYRTRLSPRTIADLDPAPQKALDTLAAHPESKAAFKAQFGYTPDELN